MGQWGGGRPIRPCLDPPLLGSGVKLISCVPLPLKWNQNYEPSMLPNDCDRYTACHSAYYCTFTAGKLTKSLLKLD